MSKIIFLGTDLHGPQTELAAKSVAKLKKLAKGSMLVSIEHRKKNIRQKDTAIIPKIFPNSRIRKILQAVILPVYLMRLRTKGYGRIFSFWVANKRYHRYLFKFLKLLGYQIVFTIISGKETNMSVLKECDLVICQSTEMKEKVDKFGVKKTQLIYPGVDLAIFRPGRKKSGIVIPSVPYSIKDFDSRGINDVLGIIKENSLPASVIFRSEEAYRFVKGLGIPGVRLINKNLGEKEIAKIMGLAKVIPLYYKDSPDMPLSAIEGLASGCAVICSGNMGLSEIIAREKCGAVVKNRKELENAIKKHLTEDSGQKNARKAAEKYFDIDIQLKKYQDLFRG